LVFSVEIKRCASVDVLSGGSMAGKIGEAVSRIDGILKVTGAAQYATDFPVPNAAAGYLIKSETAAGRVASIDASEARKLPGVIDVISHENAVKLANPRVVRGSSVLQDAVVDFFGETIGIVVAETFEEARHAARYVRVSYEKTTPRVDFKKEKSAAVKIASREDELRGDAEGSLKSSDAVVDAEYFTPIEHHQPMAPHATTAVWEAADKLTVYNESQVVNGVQGALAAAFGLKPANVRVITPHIGGGFGSKGGAWGHVFVTAMAAKIVGRPVKLALTRQMMFNSVGLRQANWQGGGRGGGP
jgi:xanthine dehydrogenase YagR molybdenum-binding subunit